MEQDHAGVIADCIERARALSGPQALGQAMFARFFERCPETRGIWADTEVPGFAPAKFRIVCELILDAVRHPEYAAYAMCSEICRHRYYGVRDSDYYYAMIDAGRDAIREAHGAAWTPALERCWDEVVTATRAAVQRGSREAA